jgi:hypothetical protein
MTTGTKYVMALLLSAGNAEGGGESSTNCNQYITKDACLEHQAACIWDASEICTSPLIGTILISLDVVFMVSSLLAIPTALFLLKKRFEKQQAHPNNEVVVHPTNNTATRHTTKFAALLDAHQAKLNKAVLNNQVGRFGKLSRVRSTRRKVEEIEHNHESHRAASVTAIRARQIEAHERLKLRRRSRTQTLRSPGEKTIAAKVEKGGVINSVKKEPVLDKANEVETTWATASPSKDNNMEAITTQEVGRDAAKVEKGGETNALNKKQVLGKVNEVELSWAAASPSKDIEVAHQSSKDIEVAREWLHKKGQKSVLRLISGGKDAVKTVTGDECLHVQRLVGLLTKLKVVDPTKFLLDQFGTSENIQTKVFLSWVFDRGVA